jgi:hypothetical protein
MNHLKGQAGRLQVQLHDEEAKYINIMNEEELAGHNEKLEKLREYQDNSAREAERLQNVYEEAFQQALDNGKTKQMNTTGQVQ